MRKLAVALIVLGFLTLVSLPLFLRPPRRGTIVLTSTSPFPDLKIRVTSWTRLVRWGYVSGGYLTAHVTLRGGEPRTLLEVEFPTPPPFPYNAVGASNRLTLWVRVGLHAAVTSDGGVTWNFWEAGGAGTIRAMSVSPQGDGYLEILRDSPSRVDTYDTRDFGRTWMLRSGP